MLKSQAMKTQEARERLAAEIERIVTVAVRAGSTVRTAYYAGSLAEAYADAGLSIGHITDAIADSALRRGVPVEITHPNREPHVVKVSENGEPVLA